MQHPLPNLAVPPPMAPPGVPMFFPPGPMGAPHLMPPIPVPVPMPPSGPLSLNNHPPDPETLKVYQLLEPMILQRKTEGNQDPLTPQTLQQFAANIFWLIKDCSQENIQVNTPILAGRFSTIMFKHNILVK